MAKFKRRSDFLDSEQFEEIKQKLLQMAGDSTFNTVSSYSSNSTQYPDNLIPFVDKHINYLIAHPNLDSTKYISNLRLMTRVR
jgi:hypothetical protein